MSVCPAEERTPGNSLTQGHAVTVHGVDKPGNPRKMGIAEPRKVQNVPFRGVESFPLSLSLAVKLRFSWVFACSLLSVSLSGS
jgi:hypothetical protein